MSAVTIFRRVSNLSKMIDTKGGTTVLAALRGAEKETAGLRDEGHAILLEAIAALQATAARTPDKNWLEAVYRGASNLIDVCPPDLEALGKAAWSLCDLADRQRAAGRLEVPPIAVHVSVIRTLGQPGLDAQVVGPLLLGLQALLAREVAKGG